MCVGTVVRTHTRARNQRCFGHSCGGGLFSHTVDYEMFLLRTPKATKVSVAANMSIGKGVSGMLAYWMLCVSRAIVATKRLRG